MYKNKSDSPELSRHIIYYLPNFNYINNNINNLNQSNTINGNSLMINNELNTNYNNNHNI